ncbi:MAG TPA: hypothetical protein VIG48_08815 [Jatrophihabitans sp.]|jgi:hypothetical protein
MALNDGDVADLAREAVDRKDPDLDIEISPAAQDDPYRWGTEAWTVSAGGASSYVRASMSRDEALATLVRDLAT